MVCYVLHVSVKAVQYVEQCVRYFYFYLLDCLYCCMYNVPYPNCIHNCLPEDKPFGSKHVEDVRN